MKKGLIAFLALSLTANAQAATKQMLWGEVDTAKLPLTQATPFTKKGLLKSLENRKQNEYQLQLITPQAANTKHARYQQMYKGIPVWGQQIIFHKNPGLKTTVTGVKIAEIEKDITHLEGKLSAAEVQAKILGGAKEAVKFSQVNKVIFIDDQSKAILAYHVSFYTNSNQKPISAPNYLVDANTGQVLKQWDGVRTESLGQGLGGNAFNLPYRVGMFQHGDALPDLPSLGKFDVQVLDDLCYVQNDNVRTMNLGNIPLGYEAFPITVFAEAHHQLAAFSYPCGKNSLYLNYADGESGPVNYSFSPVNDTMYFAQKTLDMYHEVYGVDKPIGDDLPVRAFTHLGAMDNAFAIPTIYEDGILVAHQQIIIGNGEFFITAPAQSVIAHELSHNFTELNSQLFYEGQPGGLNESFSDMAAIALQDYLRQDYPWYWDGEDWTIGREARIGGEPMRYLDEPTKDGYSIDHAKDYNDSVDVHLSSGVFNKAFYLLAHKPGWSVQMAFQMMVDANRNYWSPIAYFDFAACGVIQATVDHELDPSPVIEAFSEVGVTCPMFKS